ncbi:MerR family transcriptional regulator [Streptococcus iniae]|uniref:MerR family transcriptional regulator n=1 Tax=Streptococcus iniae TaxID=1346 RepID=UPI0008D9671C|nr:MerR family transcriptional regulator [Streptococcus iniae]OHX27085.1 MerR family transcriptional regulator [Streptococcus iniae]RLV27411.1 MerR family transcriptional regulator [Streptococcus iniae]
MKTVKEVSQIAGISIRALHYYDQIGLLKPSLIGENGYRYYDKDVYCRLQEILLFKELEFPLKTIKEILDNPSYSRYKALEDHICLLELRQKQLTQLIQHVKKLQEGESEMTFKAYDKSELEAYQKEAKERWGEGSYFKEYEILAEQLDEKQITIDMNQIFKTFGSLQHLSPSDLLVQEQVGTLQNYISDHFYNCNNDILSNLGIMYTMDKRFQTRIDHMGGRGTAAFVGQAIASYCQK